MPVDLRRADGRFARVGHRGAAALAPENTLRSLELAVELGCDMLEFDVLALSNGTIVVAHSDNLREVSHGAARGRVRNRTLDALRRVAPNLPTFDEALAHLASRFPDTVLQVDVKQRGIEDRVVAALRRHDVVGRSWISGLDASSLRRLAALEPSIPRSYTLPRHGLAKRWPLAPVVRAALPLRLPSLLERARAAAATLHHSLASAEAIDVAHRAGAAVYVWTVDDARLAQRLVDAGADGIITNDPRIFSNLNL
jgi:glycerophosphoryl diester phosphodiesterase